ncbi:hydroxyacid dehydrogenase [Candidatus Dojkabacteria bacterium]|nr:hydroxyacid dehydrogenase [Candidatus Dojkabacteria bacterium]
MNQSFKIVIAQELDLLPEQERRIKALGETTIYHDFARNEDEWFERVKVADFICSGKFGLKKKIYDLKDVVLSLPFVGVGWIDKNKIKERNITVTYCPGCNKHAVSEWVIGNMINLFRNMMHLNKIKDMTTRQNVRTLGLYHKKICILGKGNIGKKVGKISKSLGMNVEYFTRGDNLKEKTKNSDVVINCLSLNQTTKNLLNKDFFDSLKRNSFFITVTSKNIYDTDAMLDALEKGVLAGIATDCAHINVGNAQDEYYKQMIDNPKIIATPHIASRTDVTDKIANDMMIDNIENYIKGNPINILE